MIDAATLRVAFPSAAIIDNVQVLVLSPDGEVLAAIEPTLEERADGDQVAIFVVPGSLQDEWIFADVIFDHAVLQRRALHTWSTRLVFHCMAGSCAVSDEVQWALAAGYLRLLTDANGQPLLDADLRRVQ